MKKQRECTALLSFARSAFTGLGLGPSGPIYGFNLIVCAELGR